MITFEKDASDPARLFKSSFQLVQEEKFRKTAFPTLVKLENEIVRKIQRWESEKGRTFMYSSSASNDVVADDDDDSNLSYLSALVSKNNFYYFNTTQVQPSTPISTLTPYHTLLI